MNIDMKGFVFCRASGGKVEFELMPWDCRLWSETAQGGRVFVTEHTPTVEVPDDFDPQPLQVQALEAAKQKARAEFQERITEIDRQIQSLLAIEGAA